jgi:predicted nucleotidyltransferase
MSECAIHARIDERLDRIEARHKVTVLYACEAGSRAWGFPSADSDYDVRVIYVHSCDWYLSIDLERRDDTIDPPIDGEIDLHGWDLRKALGLFHDANPTLLEWLRSPIVYREDEAVLSRWRDLISQYYTPRTAAYAYRGMARSVAEQNLDDEPIPHKAYLYVLRALLAVRWVEQRRDPVPVAFDRLVEVTVDDPAVREAVEALVERKREGREQDEGPRLPVLHDLIDAELARQENIDLPSAEDPPGWDVLNTFFRSVIDGENNRP